MRGIGIDAVEVERFRGLLERQPRIAGRLFTPLELAYGKRWRDPAPRLAARFAAKEAVMKALGVGLGAFAFHDVEVVSLPSGAPTLVLRRQAEALSRRLGVEEWQLSLTHTQALAQAVAVAL
ncbi:MAG: holo-ACP synthase [Acidimicrobiales bacterium]|nr:holo-ACP synthase [Actinomycetota bacterium]